MISPEQQLKIDEWKKTSGYVPPNPAQGSWYDKVKARVEPTPVAPVVPTTPKPSFGTRVATDIKTAGDNVQQAIAGEGQFAGQTPVRRGVEATAAAFGAVPKVAGEVMPDWIKTGFAKVGELVKQGFDVPVEALSNTKLFKEASQYPEYTKMLEETLGTVAPLGEIAGTILAAGTVKPTVDIAKAGAVNGATKTLNIAGEMTNELKSVATNTKNKFVDSLPDKNKMRATFSNLDENIYKRVENPEYAQKVKNTMDTLETGTSNPYLNLVQNVGAKIDTAWNDTKSFFGETAKKYVEKGTQYDVGARLPEIIKKVDAFKTGKDIKFDIVRGKKGQITGYKLTKGRYSPYTDSEISNLNNLVGDIMSARAINADELLALDQKFGSYYNAVNPATPTAYHTAVMELKSATQERIRNLLSGDMKTAYERYARIADLKEDFGNKIVDGQGNLKPTAEQYLANLTNKNKGIAQLNTKEYSDILGMDLVNEAQVIADAKKFMLTQAPTGGRLSDFLKSNIFTGLGAGAGALVGGPLGAGAGGAAGAALGAKITSPMFLGKKAIEETLKKASELNP